MINPKVILQCYSFARLLSYYNEIAHYIHLLYVNEVDVESSWWRNMKSDNYMNTIKD